MTETLILWATGERRLFTTGDYAGDPNGCTWVLTRYSDDPCSPRCGDDDCDRIHPYECASCGNPIMDMDHLVNMDNGAESVHWFSDDDGEPCHVVHADYPHSQDTLHDCAGCTMGTP